MFKCIVIAPVFLFTCMVAHAQQSNSQYFQEQQQRQQEAFRAEQNRQGDLSQQSQGSQPSQPTGEWKKTWGAIATDVPKGVLGFVVGAMSKREAEQAALSDCRAKGGQECKVDIAYRNQCAAMVLGSKVYNTSRAETAEIAGKSGIRTCEAEDTNCHVYYSACSEPRFVRY